MLKKHELGMMVDEQRCYLCNRTVSTEEGFCRYHAYARQRLYFLFSKWKEAYGSLSWQEYLEQVMISKETGQWVKDVIQYHIASKMVRKNTSG